MSVLHVFSSQPAFSPTSATCSANVIIFDTIIVIKRANKQNSRSFMYEVSSSPLYVFPLRHRHLLQHPILKHSHPTYLYRNEEKVLNLYSTTGGFISRESSVCTPRKHRGGAEVQIRLFLTAALDGANVAPQPIHPQRA